VEDEGLAETRQGAAPSVPVFPPGRYGRRRASAGGSRRRRRGPLLLGAAGALVGLVLAGILYARHGNPTYQPTVVGYDLAADHATVRFRLHKPADRTAVCHLRARSRDGAEVGSADVVVPVGDNVDVSHTFATSGPPMAVELTWCGAPPPGTPPQDR
jgi:hypothetical protein